MKICLAQTLSKNGDIQYNIDHHLRWIKNAAEHQVNLIVFPELSLTGYAPEIANDFATDIYDVRFDIFDKLSSTYQMHIALGMPIHAGNGIYIGMLIFSPNQPRAMYAKQFLDPDEASYFTPGRNQYFLNVNNKKIAFAICYESLKEVHLKNALAHGIDLYIASVAKSQKGIEKACVHYSKMAHTYTTPILFTNCIGLCDTFESKGQSSVWDDSGRKLTALPSDKEGLLIYNTVTKETTSL